MKQILFWAAIVSVLFTGAALGKSNGAAPLTGTWECVAHGFPKGDVNFTLYLTQHEDQSITGWVSSPLGTADLMSVTFENDMLKIQIDAPQGLYRLNGQFHKGQFSGDWARGADLKGNWEGKKTSTSPDPK